ncbi:hypothetical protein [Rothia terrae]|uniref:Uncharacterized protein n=1 Tax=Rothia terrae TaxID=396015 RepID=A0A7H2BFQ9_9MICC|nr:hypothetical protein [Rothia terrae]QNV38505.1 hypothetical protein IDM49_04375 [Rothia terrae]
MRIDREDISELLANDGTLAVAEKMATCIMYAHSQNYADFERRTAGWDKYDKKVFIQQNRSLSATSLSLLLIKRLAKTSHADALKTIDLWNNDWFEFRHKEVQIYLLRSTSNKSSRKKQLDIINTIKDDMENLFDESDDISADLYRSRLSPNHQASVDDEPLYCQLEYRVGRNGMLTKAVFSAQTISQEHPIFTYELDLVKVRELLEELLASDPDIFTPATLLRQNTVPAPALQTHQLSPVQTQDVGRELDTSITPAPAPLQEEERQGSRKSL